ncbi:MAG: hypothetical protein NC249_13305, partial [Lachnoclostridium sp.]|nr:hypothetical protein [Lachnoclostridium sp.]
NIAVCDDEKCMADKIEKMTKDYIGKKNVRFSVSEYSSGEELLNAPQMHPSAEKCTRSRKKGSSFAPPVRLWKDYD